MIVTQTHILVCESAVEAEPTHGMISGIALLPPVVRIGSVMPVTTSTLRGQTGAEATILRDAYLDPGDHAPFVVGSRVTAARLESPQEATTYRVQTPPDVYDAGTDLDHAVVRLILEEYADAQ